MSARSLAAALALAALALAACSRPRLETPKGFAALEGGRVYRAVSPEGVRLQVRSVRNEPRQEIAFWAEALRTHLASQGYRPAGEPQRFRAGKRDGRLFEWSMPYGTETWTYVTGVMVAGRRIVVVEAAGERELFKKHRDAVLAGLSSLSP